MPTVRQVEALVAQRKVGDLLIAQSHGEPHPIVEGGIDDLVARETSPIVRRRDMADLSAPALDQADDQRIRHEGCCCHAGRADRGRDRKSTRLNSSHEWISYAVFCLKKK